jgi:hypothetical protein
MHSQKGSQRSNGNSPRASLRCEYRTYWLLLGALEAHFRNLNDDNLETYRLIALSAMDIVNDLNRALVHAGLLPPFQMPSA